MDEDSTRASDSSLKRKAEGEGTEEDERGERKEEEKRGKESQIGEALEPMKKKARVFDGAGM